MGIVIALVVIVLVLGGIALLVEGMIWLALIALAILAVSALFGFSRRGASA